MEKKHHNIDDLFNDKLTNFEVEPPAYVWDNIQSKLDAKGTKKRFVLWFSIAASIALIVSFGAGYIISDIQTNRTNRSISKNTNLENEAVQENSELNQSTTRNKSSVDSHPNETTEGTVENDAPSTKTESPAPKEASNSAVKNADSPSNQSKGASSSISAGSKSNTTSHYSNVVKSFVPASKATTVAQNNKIKEDQNRLNVDRATNAPNDYFSETNEAVLNTPNQHQPINNNEVVAREESVNADNTKSEEQTNGSTEPIAEEKTPSIQQEATSPIVKENQENIAITNPEPAELVIEKRRNMSVKAYFSPIYPIMNASANQDRFYSATSSGNTFKSSPEFSYGAGLDVGYDINKNWSISVGFAYNQIGMSTNRTALQMQKYGGDELPDGFLSDVYTATGKITGMNVYQSVEDGSSVFNTDKGSIGNTLRISQQYGFLEVPIKAQYKHTWGRVSILATAGISTGFLVRNQAYAVGEENQRTLIGESASMNNVNFNAIVGIGIEVRILPFMSFAVEPMFRYSFVNWSNDAENGFNVKPMLINLNTGLIFKL